ncbi:MAG: NAD-dependent epimerase/dehydratase family protein [Puniceicoccales bacterium]|jgi:nucleoside-diphosphate-sugar epimerase|nr:NAD-dependent epimerase/dehydratase family protein [Puniceicoccales bacterium]
MHKKIFLVTGVAGFIASKVAALLLADGHRVIGLDNFEDHYRRLKEYRLDWVSKQAGAENFSYLHKSVGDRNALENIFISEKIDAVIHLAARAGVRQSLEEPAAYMETNASFFFVLLEAMHRHGVAKLVLASTSSMYAGQSAPFSEDLPADKPLSPYAVSKRAAELAAYNYHKLYDFDVAILRYFTVFGPAGRPDMSVFRFIQDICLARPIRIFGDGKQVRDFTYVDDIARGTVAAAVTPSGFEIINLGGGSPMMLNDMIAGIERVLKKKAERIFVAAHAADMEATGADISKAARLLAWRPMVAADEALRATVCWHLKNHAWITQEGL